MFDNYYNDSVKSGERLRRAEGVTAVKTSIAHFDQLLPPATELPKFWASTENKVSLQQFFIKWISQKYEDECPLYLGGCHVGGINYCYKVSIGSCTKQNLLFCEFEEADNHIQFHINHAVAIDGIEAAIVCSGDTDVFTSFTTITMYGNEEA